MTEQWSDRSAMLNHKKLPPSGPLSYLHGSALKTWTSYWKREGSARGVIKRREVGIFPFYSGLIPCLYYGNLYWSYMENIWNPPPTLPWPPGAKNVNETPVPLVWTRGTLQRCSQDSLWRTCWWKVRAWKAQDDLEAADREGSQTVEALSYQPSW